MASFKRYPKSFSFSTSDDASLVADAKADVVDALGARRQRQPRKQQQRQQRQQRQVAAAAAAAASAASRNVRVVSFVSERTRELLLDGDDAFHRRLAPAVLVGAALLAVCFVFGSHTTHAHPDADAGDRRSDTTGTGDQATSALLQSVARDTGLTMALVAPFPSWLLNTHAWAGFALVTCALLQKYNVRWLAARVSSSSSSSSPSSSSSSSSSSSWRSPWAWPQRALIKAHAALGYACIALSLAMAYAGFHLRTSSAFAGFALFSYAFAAPFVALAAALLVTGQRAAMRTRGAVAVHRLVGNALLKACIAVPLSRVTGALLQRVAVSPSSSSSSSSSLLDEQSAFYGGIGATTLVILAWAVHDAIEFVRASSSL